MHGLAEMLYAIRSNGHNPYPASFGTPEVDRDGRGQRHRVTWEGEIICGHDPYLYARLATVWPVGDGSGRIAGEDDPRPAPR